MSEVGKVIKNGSTIAVGGFTINRKPLALIKELEKSDAGDLSLFLLGGSIDVDTLIRRGRIKKISAAYVGYEGIGFSNTLRTMVENKTLFFEDLTEIIYYYRLKAGALGIPFLDTESVINSDILKINSACEKILDEEGLPKTRIRKINPDICLIHAQRSDMLGNILIDEPDFCEKEMARASKITIVSVEEMGVINKNEITIPFEDVDYLVVCKKGAWPTGCRGYYPPNIKELKRFMEQ